VRFFQIQWHGFSGHGFGPTDAKERHDAIEAELLKTHTIQWTVGDLIWQSWERR
jgi:hypothetical protein